MTKDQELAAISAFTRSLPPNTYLRPWLDAVLPEIARSLQSDILPEPGAILGPAACYHAITEARRKCDTMLRDARRTGNEIVDRAKGDADNIRRDARSKAAEALRNLASSVEVGRLNH